MTMNEENEDAMVLDDLDSANASVETNAQPNDTFNFCGEGARTGIVHDTER
ncbi:hypothetical protein [Schleiferilactobacillus shenzhenensis]|uniref:Uncharacterized protein n=1 Tax=Schleiferilactobacillus shenzhenensis LY-73 TaxID=1231336 RepID=U4TP32_9LACO|nr:hypothetical protein [Schleiferilactobacillus shenzhenensis]ERL63658.1 hypothetical protein L248_2475 [Schleiferilactobacillus shenzhenensis LY-73]